MRVIETFVTTVLREEISPTAEFFTQDWDDGLLCQYQSEPYVGDVDWLGAGYGGSFGLQKISEDARTAIITREELMKAYDLVEQGYTLWFGGDIPVPHSTGVSVALFDGSIQSRLAGELWWGNREPNPIIAYRLSETEDKSSNLAPLSEEKVKAIQSVIANNQTKTWSYHPDSILVNKETGKFPSGADDFAIITKDEWNTYLDSVKIEVGDTVSFIHSNVFYEVLYVGEEKAFIKDSDGTEYSFPLEELSKVVK